MDIDSIDSLQELAKELKDEKNKNVYQIFDDYALKHKLDSEVLEQKLSKEHDCFRCDSCERFFTYEEYSFFDEECIYCFDSDDEDEEF
ncbi:MULTISPECIES: hypothetical protein [Arcobacteraceae]|uniref:Uncharacterized protein n=1 Tax=Aliarcobacter thereius LMG 24486 TaxID=1032240 RepID=A0A1C7WR94_9BACT|nr:MULTISPECIES: hypothetical protein [Arcobacteraceae]OCL81788.1 hypothetical protein AAW29_01761 [Arcobacter porcinus]OCL82284.1 hypothetical protein AAW30_01569 [Arcobacter porcinus]OCL95803.1 hypothetical protein AA347_01285 [Aliarcobacter thereius LMG 24486]QBF16223.1 hypothetical protein ATH_1168 [Aliarcobacter thereius LMG 24486]TLS92153.1 hypothetical protein FE244_07055 [Aliarcobacter thereius]